MAMAKRRRTKHTGTPTRKPSGLETSGAGPTTTKMPAISITSKREGSKGSLTRSTTIRGRGIISKSFTDSASSKDRHTINGDKPNTGRALASQQRATSADKSYSVS